MEALETSLKRFNPTGMREDLEPALPLDLTGSTKGSGGAGLQGTGVGTAMGRRGPNAKWKPRAWG